MRIFTTLVYGYVNSDNPGFLSEDTYDNSHYVAADLIWTPYKPVALGAEYLLGRRENKDGASGTANRYFFSFRFDFCGCNRDNHPQTKTERRTSL